MNGMLGANLGLCATILVWGTPIPFLDDLLDRWDPIGMAMLRYLIALPVLAVLLLATQPQLLHTRRILPETTTWPQIWALSVIGVVGFAVFFLLGLAHSDPVTIAIMAAMSPVIAAVIGWLCYRERPASGIGLALVLAVLGGLMTRVDFAGGGLAVEFQGGEPMMLAAIICWAWYSITAQRWMPGASQLHITTVSVIPATLVLAAGYWALRRLDWVERFPVDPTTQDMALIAWIAVSSIVIGVVAWNYGVKRLGVVVASMYLNFIPVVAVITAAIIGFEPRIEQLAGGLLVLAGVAQAQYRRFAASRTPPL